MEENFYYITTYHVFESSINSESYQHQKSCNTHIEMCVCVIYICSIFSSLTMTTTSLVKQMASNVVTPTNLYILCSVCSAHAMEQHIRNNFCSLQKKKHPPVKLSLLRNVYRSTKPFHCNNQTRIYVCNPIVVGSVISRVWAKCDNRRSSVWLRVCDSCSWMPRANTISIKSHMFPKNNSWDNNFSVAFSIECYSTVTIAKQQQRFRQHTLRVFVFMLFSIWHDAKWSLCQ